MGERTDQIEQQINQTRENLSDNFSELEERVKSAFDWRAQFEERPFTLLAVAFGSGILASALLPPRPPRRKRRVIDYATDSNGRNARKAVEKPAAVGNGRSNQRSESLDALKGALMTVAAGRLGGIVGDFLAGYKQELHKVRQYCKDSSL